MKSLVQSLVVVLALLGFAMPVFAAESVLRDGDRIVVVGDSITGQGLGKNGYVGLMEEALKKAHAGTKTTLTALGGSGQNVGSWVGIEKDSRERHFALDNPKVDVKDTLDGGADVVIIMLGMNNVLRPDTGNTPEAIQGWATNYQNLVTALHARTHARVIALATPTLCTEDFNGPKNILMDQMSVALVELAATNKCIVLPVRESSKKALIEGRSRNPDFHLSQDFVHPQPIGHLAIATGMLEGLGEVEAAKAIYADRAPELWKPVGESKPSVSYMFEPMPSKSGEAADVSTFKVRFWVNGLAGDSKVSIKLPEAWTASPASVNAAAGEFVVSGPLDRLHNVLTINAVQNGTAVKADIDIPAAWIVGVGNYGREGWVSDNGFKFDPIKGRLPIDEELIKGIGFDKPVEVTPAAEWHKKIEWKKYIASMNYPGGDDPGSIDLSAIYYFGVFDVAYGARWIYSPTDRSVPLAFDSHTFAGDYYLSLWLNGQSVRESSDRKGKAELKLRKGWNAVVFKSNHLEWQWQFDIKMVETPGNDLSDLRFSTVPRAETAEAAVLETR